MIEIQQMLAARGIRSKALKEEYLDHYCSKYEQLLVDDIPHEQAIYIIHQEISAFDFREANRQYFKLHYQKPLLMTSTFILLLATLFLMPSTENTEILTSEECIESQAYHALLVSNEEPPSINPVPDQYFKVSSGFGMRMHPTEKVKKFHRGVDIKAATGTPVIATSSGVIVEAGFHPKKGNYIEIKHDDNYSTRYWHLHKIGIKVDQEITIGTKIGEIGSTGFSFGPHLHYEVIKNGKNVNPRAYLKV